MLANLLGALDKNAEVLFLGALLLALGFRRNRYAICLLALATLLLADSLAHPGLGLAVAALVLASVVLPEPALTSPQALVTAALALALPWLPAHMPATMQLLDGAALSPVPTLGSHLNWAGTLVALAAITALLRWSHRGFPLDLYLALALIPAILTLGGAAALYPKGWLAWTAAGIAIGVLLGAFRMAFVDALTGLPNRRALDERLARSQGRIAVAMVDVDHFKRFNDRHGHEAGDRVLKAVARELRRCRGGKAYRYGGEEFSIVFEGRQVERASAALEQVRTAIEARRVKLSGRSSSKRAQAVRRGQAEGEVGVTVSIGLAERDPDRRSAEAVVDAADKALYRSKQRGRNRLTLAGATRAA